MNPCAAHARVVYCLTNPLNTGIRRNQFKGLHLQMTFWMGLTMLTSTFSFTSDVTNKILGKKIISNLFHTNGSCLVLSTLKS